jgi:hypothetical protein
VSYEAIREGLNRLKQRSGDGLSESDKLLMDALQQLTVALESDLTQIKVALGHVARLLEARGQE